MTDFFIDLPGLPTVRSISFRKILKNISCNAAAADLITLSHPQAPAIYISGLGFLAQRASF
jgi:hypothetical protein